MVVVAQLSTFIADILRFLDITPPGQTINNPYNLLREAQANVYVHIDFN